MSIAMIDGRRLFTRFCARLSAEERGFSLLETILAITIIFGSLTVLAYSASSGFGYQALARDRQSANGIADRIMEEVRGLAYEKIQRGLAVSELSTDSNLVTNCAGDTPQPIYRFQSCSGERVVANGQPNTPPLVPHTGTISAGYPTPYTYRVYVTNDDPSRNPYRVTVMVSWAGGAVNGVVKSVTTQSLFWSPSGCVSSQTHPYAAPCQPFFFGQAEVPRGEIEIAGVVQGLSFQSLHLFQAGVEADGQQEQFTAAQAAFTQSGAEFIDGSGARQTVGGAAATSAGSDTDPSGTIPVYGSQTLTGGIGGSATLDQGQTSLTVNAPSGDAATALSSTTANSAQPCPPWPPQELDNAICAGSQIQQGPTGSLSATADFTNIYQNVDLGTASLATIGATTSDPNTAFVDRQLASGVDGLLVTTATRSSGTVTLIGLPSDFDTSPFPEFAQWQGYLVQLSGYSDTVTASVGTGATDPSGAVTGGTISYWNGTGYTSVPATQAVTPAPIALVQTTNGHIVELDIFVQDELSPPALAASHTALSGTPAAHGEADAVMSGPINGTVRYVIRIDGAAIVDLTMQVELGSMSARAVYARAPSAG